MPGIALYYATAMTLGGFATGLIVESHEGRPTKIEGNPDHPFSLGAANVFHQASILELYDPDRTRTVLRAGETSSWEEFLADLVPALAEQSAKGGAGLRILTETVTSPTMAAQIGALLKQYPQAQWHQYEPWNRDRPRLAVTEAHYDFAKARVVVALDSDFLFTHPASLPYARQFSQSRRTATDTDDSAHADMSRLYVAEPTPSVTGTMADHRLACGAGEIAGLAQELVSVLAGRSGSIGGQASRNDWLKKVARDLQANRGASLVVAGEGQPDIVHRLASQINQQLGNIGSTVNYRPSAEAQAVAQTDSLKELAAAMHAGQVELLVQFGGNPAYDAPADLDFAGAPWGRSNTTCSSVSSTTRPPNTASGTSRRRITWKAGGTPAPSTARCRSFNP